jgi:hypothetical protein
MPPGVRYSVSRVPNGENARIIDKTLLPETFEEMERAARDREVGCSMSQDRLSSLLSENLNGAVEFFPESGGRHGIKKLVAVTVCPDLMTGIRNLAGQSRVYFSHFTKHKKCSADSRFAQNFEKGPCTRDHPIPDRQCVVERRLGPVFNIDGQ